jgi:hypothetical protein
MRKALPESQAQSSPLRDFQKVPSRRRMKAPGWARRMGVAAIAIGALSSSALATGCAVSESDVHRWESTVRGPYKLVAVVLHDKYSWQLRIEAALALIQMPPRGGRRMGISYLCDKYKDDDMNDQDGALATLPEDARRKIVAGMVPAMIAEIQKPPPAKKPDNTVDPDPSIPFKDAAFAMLSHEPSLVSDPKAKEELVAALNQWVQTDFENRIENSAQQYGVEQIMRFLGAGSVRSLPGLINENSTKVDKMASLIADLGDADTKLKGSEALVVLGKRIDSQAWYDKEKPIVADSDAKSGAKVTPAQLDAQIRQYQDQELTKVFGSMKRLGGRPVVDFCIGYGADAKNSPDRRQAALAALEGRIDKNNTGDTDKLFAIAKDDNTPDPVRDQAFNRLGELPKELIVTKLYTLFESKKWKVRWVAANLILKTMSTRDIPDFMRHLPTTAATKMGMSEFTSYGSLILTRDAPAGAPKPKELVAQYLSSKELAAKLTALGAYYGGSKSDLAKIQPLEADTSPVPKCDKDDDCGWSCDIPKPGSQDTETKAIVTVGDFAKYCVAPSLTGK